MAERPCVSAWTKCASRMTPGLLLVADLCAFPDIILALTRCRYLVRGGSLLVNSAYLSF